MFHQAADAVAHPTAAADAFAAYYPAAARATAP